MCEYNLFSHMTHHWLKMILSWWTNMLPLAAGCSNFWMWLPLKKKNGGMRKVNTFRWTQKWSQRNPNQLFWEFVRNRMEHENGTRNSTHAQSWMQHSGGACFARLGGGTRNSTHVQSRMEHETAHTSKVEWNTKGQARSRTEHETAHMTSAGRL